MKKFLNMIITLLIIAIIIVVGLIIAKYAKNQANEREVAAVLTKIKSAAGVSNNTITEEKEIEAEYKGYKILGTIKIDKINIEYPILEYTNDDTLKISITKFWGDKVNQVGNFVVAGHNNYDGTMFGKTKKLEIGDTVKLTDMLNITREYTIYKKYITDPNDTTVIETDEFGTREVTLITCSNGNKERLILKAREKSN